MRSVPAPEVSTPPAARKSLRLCLLGAALAASSALAGAAQAEQSGFDLTLEKAIELHEAGGFEAAIQIYESLREDRPNDAHLLYELAKSSLAVSNLSGCVDSARRSAAQKSEYQAAAFGVLARCEREAGFTAQSLATYVTALELYPDNPSLHFDHGLALMDEGRGAAADAQFSLALEWAAEQPSLYLAYGNLIGATSEAGGLLMNLRYIMAAPQSQLAVGAAEQILAMLDRALPAKAAARPISAFDAAFLEARLATQPADGEAVSDADRLSRFLQQFVLNTVNAASPELTDTLLWTGAMEPMLAMAEHDVLDTYLYFVGALARTEGSPEWLSAHR
jgi:Flp pilus assembly protein TadD